MKKKSLVVGDELPDSRVVIAATSRPHGTEEQLYVILGELVHQEVLQQRLVKSNIFLKQSLNTFDGSHEPNEASSSLALMHGGTRSVFEVKQVVKGFVKEGLPNMPVVCSKGSFGALTPRAPRVHHIKELINKPDELHSGFTPFESFDFQLLVTEFNGIGDTFAEGLDGKVDLHDLLFELDVRRFQLIACVNIWSLH